MLYNRRRRRQESYANGICTYHTCNNKLKEGYTMCEKHHMLMTEHNRKMREKARSKWKIKKV